MKNSKKTGIFSALILIFLSPLIQGTEEKIIQQQTYTPQVIINAPWGNKSGEFGLYVEGPIMGPSTFTIAPNGDIYIVDTFNNRIQRFTPAGSFVAAFPAVGSGWAEDIAVDANGNVYLLFLGPARVWKSDQEGNRLKIIETFDNYENRHDEDIRGMDIGGGPTKIFCDNSGRLFMRYYSEKDLNFKIFQLGTDVAEFSPAQQKATLRTGFVSDNGLSLNQDRIFGMVDGKMYLLDNTDKAVKEYKHIANPRLLVGTDAEGCIYLHAFDMDKDTELVRKYDPEGRLLAVIEWKNVGYAQHNLNRSITVDAKGDVYVLGSSKDGITLTKWSPSGK